MSVQTSPPAQPTVDPLAKVTLRPRTFAAVLAVAGLLVGLVLVLLPLRVSTLDTTKTTKLSCGNILGGVETPK
ncbi:hypothetical protein GCM10029964_004600 [Kibdelosporangium lantanae]